MTLLVLNKTRLAALMIIGLLIIPNPILLVKARSSTSPLTDIVIDPRINGMVSRNPNTIIPVILKFKDGLGFNDITRIIDGLNIPDFEVRHVFHLIPMVSAYVSGNSLSRLKSLTSLVGISLEEKRTMLPLRESNDWKVSTPEGYIHPDELMGATDLWDEGYNGNGTTIAVIDTGAMGDHPDLEGRIIGFKDFINNLDDLDPSDGIDAYDDNGHGTATAWLAAGTGENTGFNYSGMAPGADLLIIKALDAEGSADTSILSQAIEFAVDYGVDVISISVGGEWTDGLLSLDSTISSVKIAVASGVTVVIAAGNSGPATNTINSPGIVEEAITVGASIADQGVADFSSRGPVEFQEEQPRGIFAKPDIVAPGYRVLSGRWYSSNPVEYPPDDDYGPYYTLFSGTSASAPQIAGLVALLKSKYSTLTPLQAKLALMKGAIDLNEDPMAQGWGLANVSRAAELLEHEPITIMSPRRFPVLPEGTNVFVYGDTRKPQNVTVISQIDRGVLTITATGNASTFITVVDDVDVSKGYSYFGISLTIPEDLPLTAIGEYMGTLELKEASTVIASIELKLRITSYGGSLLVDSSHHSSLDPDSPDSYKYFGEYLREQGMVMEELGSVENPATITIETLLKHEAFMIMDTELTYSQAEIDAIHSFVEQGGTLLILSEFYNSTTDTASFAIDSYNQILEPYGIQCEKVEIGVGSSAYVGRVYGVDYGGAVESSPLTEGVENLYVLYGSTLSVDPSVSGAKGLLWMDSAKTHALVAYAEYGNGKVIAVSDGSTLYDTTIYDSFKAGADNLKLLENIAKEMTTEAPKILDVVVKVDRDNNRGNVTAFIFDDDLADVRITLQLPNGTEILGSVDESLGYKFTMIFDMPGAGSYRLNITAMDSSGHVKKVVDEFVIPARPVDDVVLMTVLFALLGVIGVSLGYVGLKRFMGGKKRQHEWEPQWVDDGGGPPPSSSPPEIV